MFRQRYTGTCPGLAITKAEAILAEAGDGLRPVPDAVLLGGREQPVLLLAQSPALGQNSESTPLSSLAVPGKITASPQYLITLGARRSCGRRHDAQLRCDSR